MAGESPDRSKQRESSAEQTSGSAGPVPEKQDPRLAVAREREKERAAGSGAGSGSDSGSAEGRGKGDTATRVLTVREASASEPEGESGTDDAPVDGDAGGPGEGAGNGDGRLREAVATWVRSAEPEEAEEASKDAEAGAEDPGDDSDSDEPEAASDAEEEAAAGDEDAGGKGEAAGDDASDEATEGEGPKGESPKGETREGDDAEGSNGRQTEAGDAKGAEDDADEDKAADAKAAGTDATADKAEDGDSGDDSDDDDDKGGNAKATAKDGDKAADSPVDQPTAVFRAPRPAEPGVDQPTTMLKVGDAAARNRTGAPEAERTSKFVALKDDPAIRQTPRQGGPAAAESTTFLPQVGPERTTQQPLPPKPPLDLLAELTNTPPPPQTPLRTAVRRIKIWTPLVLLLLIVFAVVQNVRPLPAPTLVLTAEDTHIFDGDQVKLPWPDEGQGWMSGDGIGTMDHFGEQEPVAIGSVAKTMTAYIILRDHPLKPGEEGPKIEVDAKAEEEGGYDKAGESTLNTVKAGDFLTEKQALSAVMIPSANNIARLLARWDAGSEEAFVKKMNDTAKELGMTNTTYTDPSGLKETTVSTAEDQTKLGIVAMRNPAMVAITSAASWTDPSGQYWSNYNELPYTMGAIGIKTGSTTKAGGNLLFAARKEVSGQEVTVVGAILGQHKGPSILDTVNEVSKPALRAAQDALTSATILKKGTVVGYADDGLGGRTPVAVTEDVKAVGWAGLEVKLTFTGTELPHTAKAGTKVGTLTVGDGENGAVKVPVALQADLVEPGFTDKLTRVA
ncbi:D-alanyl-D-alanine carboxypeptidase [Streptomyces gancidicus BKS 13-15]|uniref:serine-type D-Ala-D-Ala carboxypeptidase n=1 Tax=Streptomyces gancidicus BKS 13-15 TaxID=1284664 RepID=M3BLE5_STREZ|nr:D-alanyl-D-alanine carboxypeptidase [Streptomyces gancidicus]EMF24609.1 D-alanyl-D-alanine carboxypeptidase [Streptomyces gancidicus BKS 13-15]